MDEFEPQNELEVLWGGLLSEDAGRVRRVWGDLTDEEAQAVMAQLRTMVADPERAEVQRRAARFAIEAVRDAY